MSETPRLAVWSDESLQAPDGYQVACAKADEPGYWILNRGWTTLDKARAFADEHNEQLGHTSTLSVLEVRASSLAACGSPKEGRP